ncbi:dynein light intermediate chain NDAI_0I02130 [Naumovozyma dairenensis CBS 421]|uniref:Uncharacterized protein n=1 Tax=Naumovozyma dairenensis (strain ATCC 10597 / BCRC 20456 / CBS 421 / NBRC 0211 / NRRL Y-12639) TaxID=1071378 RepID=G0WG71_NAUDC|nr:hypothetical protein NDAI_0I02130 [Naumovozyma dairenensis CBS 421]CCD26782.1 hypothetical protein NDAI_0I02130 [Naumovozyma dairenensis CBS 421]
MDNAWEELLSEHVQEPLQKDATSTAAIFCSPNRSSLQQVDKLFFCDTPSMDPCQSNFELLKFRSLVYKDSISKTGQVKSSRDLDVYFLYTPFPGSTLDIIENIISARKNSVSNSFELQWHFVLDWAETDHRQWLNYLHSYFQELKERNLFPPSEKCATIWCINTDSIYSLLKSSTLWHTHHIDFIQQSLRVFCLFENCSLIYASLSKEDDKQFYRDLFRDAYENTPLPIEMASFTKLVIPHRSDTRELIKTLDEDFHIPANLDAAFFEKYKEVLPLGGYACDIASPTSDSISPNIHDLLDEQYQLSKIYSKLSKSKV